MEVPSRNGILFLLAVAIVSGAAAAAYVFAPRPEPSKIGRWQLVIETAWDWDPARDMLRPDQRVPGSDRPATYQMKPTHWLVDTSNGDVWQLGSPRWDSPPTPILSTHFGPDFNYEKAVSDKIERDAKNKRLDAKKWKYDRLKEDAEAAAGRKLTMDEDSRIFDEAYK